MEPQSQSSTEITNLKVKHPALKIILVIITIIILFLAILPLFLNPIVDNLIKQQIKALFGEKLQIGSINVSFWTGATINIHQIELRQPPGYRQGNLMKAESIKIRVALIPLLKQQLLLREITIIQPELYFIQARNGKTNFGVYLSKFTRKPSRSSGSGLQVRLNQFKVRNGKFILVSYTLSDQQPAFELTNCNVNLKNLELPNFYRIATEFNFDGLLGIAHPAPIKVNGIGVFGAPRVSFTASTVINNLTLSDYSHLIPDSTFNITSGKAWISSDTRCNNNYLNSYQHVTVKDLKLTAKKGHALRGSLLGVPANMLTTAIEDEKGSFNFDFLISGRFNDIKVNLKFKVLEAVAKSIRAKLGLTKITDKAVTGVKKVGDKVINTFKDIIKN